MVRSRCGISAVGGRGGCRRVPFGLPARRTQVLARRSSGTRFGREQVPCLLLDQRSHPTEPEVAAPALICGPATREVRRTRPVSDRPWPRGAKRTPCTPAQRPSLAPRRKTYGRARAAGGRWWPGGARGTPCGPGQRSSVAPRRKTYGRARAAGGRWWPGGARGTPRTRNWWSSVARRRKPTQHPVRAAYILGPAAPAEPATAGHTTPIPTAHQLMQLRTPRTQCAVAGNGAKSGSGGGQDRGGAGRIGRRARLANTAVRTSC